ncbi:MAG: SHOCT domain-containing protein [Bacteroidota bacterium]|nr:SHOCT domain-containing protein [Bacteroidota bacterium]
MRKILYISLFFIVFANLTIASNSNIPQKDNIETLTNENIKVSSFNELKADKEWVQIVLFSIGAFLVFFIILSLSSKLTRKISERTANKKGKKTTDKNELDSSDKVAILEKLSRLKERGEISEDEFEELKNGIL